MRPGTGTNLNVTVDPSSVVVSPPVPDGCRVDEGLEYGQSRVLFESMSGRDRCPRLTVVVTLSGTPHDPGGPSETGKTTGSGNPAEDSSGGQEKCGLPGLNGSIFLRVTHRGPMAGVTVA